MHLFPDFSSFEAVYKAGRAQLVWARLSADLETPVSAALKLDNEAFCALFESVEKGRSRARYSFIALEPELIWRCVDGKAEINRTPENANAFTVSKEAPFESLRALMKESELEIPNELPSMAYGLFGYMAYDMVRLMEKLPEKNKDTIGIPDSIYVRPRVVVVFDSAKDEMLVVTAVQSGKDGAKAAWGAAVERIDGALAKLDKSVKKRSYLDTSTHPLKLGKPKSNLTREQYHANVKKAQEYIKAGDIFQVVPSQRFTVDFPHSPMALYRSLRQLNPSPFSFYMHIGEMALVGSSPEILVRLKDDTVTIRPIAGTRKRGATEAEDRALAEDLMADEKELAEHLMLLDLGRNDVGRVAATGTVKVTDQMVIEYYSHVMHIVSNVEGKLAKGKDALSALIAGFPAGTVSGAPKIRAMEIIEELEPERRSFYAGCVGYFSADGSMDNCIALRTGLVKDGKLYIQAGGGVVVDSVPEDEYQESCNKAKALMRAAELAGEFE